jgi:hypothetical protein
MNRIDLYLKALGKAFRFTGEIAPWPIHVAIPSIYCGDHEAADLFSKLEKISKENQHQKILSKLFDGPSAAKALLMDLIVGLKVAKPPISAEKRVWFVNHMLEGIERMQAGDIFCRHYTNQILDAHETKKLFGRTPWIWLKTKKDKEVLGHSIYKVSASAKSLIWSLFFYGWDDVGYEIHGPYEIKTENGRKYQLLITDYFNLKPILLWPEIESFPYRSIRMMALYPKSAYLAVDIFIHLFNKDNLLETTEAIYLEANGVPVRKPRQIELLSRKLLERTLRQQKKIEEMNKEKIIQKYIESRYYAFRRWRWYFGENWKPPKEVIDRIKEWGVIEIPPKKTPTWKELKKAFDPRTDFVPNQT